MKILFSWDESYKEIGLISCCDQNLLDLHLIFTSCSKSTQVFVEDSLNLIVSKFKSTYGESNDCIDDEKDLFEKLICGNDIESLRSLFGSECSVNFRFVARLTSIWRPFMKVPLSSLMTRSASICFSIVPKPKPCWNHYF